MQSYKKKWKIKNGKWKIQLFLNKNNTFCKKNTCALAYSKNYLYLCRRIMISHQGIVISVSGCTAHVTITQASACEACKAKSMCTSAESKVKEMDVTMLEPLQPGDKVEVMVRERLAWRAVLLGYILPFVVMLGVIAVLDLTTSLDEAVTGTVALCAIAVYYLILRLFRNKLQKEFSFTARKV